MPTLNDTHFSRSVTLICEHSLHEGAMGIVINQPTAISMTELLPEDHLADSYPPSEVLPIPIYSGGPVDIDRGFILYSSTIENDSDLEILPNLYLTSSREMLSKIACGDGPDDTLIVVGYAGWAPGQLEEELSANAWLTTPYQHQLVFNTPTEQQWLASGEVIGVDLNLLSSQPGHA